MLAGICNICCRRPALPGRNICRECFSRRRETNSARYYGRKAAGLCTVCGRPNDSGFAKCPECRERFNAYRKQRWMSGGILAKP